MRIWDLGENKCTHQLIPEEDVSVASVTVASDGTLLCAGNNSVSYTVPMSRVWSPLVAPVSLSEFLYYRLTVMAG